jgi:hypothetical protein
MTAVAAQVNRDAIRTSRLTHHRGGNEARLWRAARLPHSRNVVNIYVRSFIIRGQRSEVS